MGVGNTPSTSPLPQGERARRRVYICSPYAGEVARNVLVARTLCRRAAELGYAPFAPHLIYPQITDESDPAERALGISMGLAFMPACDEVWVYVGFGRSEGMRTEIEEAERLGMSILVGTGLEDFW